MQLARKGPAQAALNTGCSQRASQRRLRPVFRARQTPKHAQPAVAVVTVALHRDTASSSTSAQQLWFVEVQQDESFTTSSSKQHARQVQPPQLPRQAAAGAARISVLDSTAAAAAYVLLDAGSAAAAKIEVDVPDFLVEHSPLDGVLHSPVLAVGAAVLALLLFPKLIRVSINYLLYPAVAALLAYLAISHPAQTANSVYVLLQFAQEHPAAASVAVVVAAGVLLGPDILAGSALAGVVLLLAAQAGLVQLPQPQLPKLPGQQVVGQQFGKAGAALKQRVLELDSDDHAVNDSIGERLLPAALTNTRQQQEQQRGSSSAVADLGGSPAAEQPAAAQAALQALQGFGKRAAAASKGLAERAQDILPGHQEVQTGQQVAGKGSGSAALQPELNIQDLVGKVQQEGLGDRLQGLGERVAAAAGAAVERAKGLTDKAGSLALGQAIVQQQQQQQQRQTAVSAEDMSSSDGR